MTINKDQWEGYEAAFQHFNRELFDGNLPVCMLTFDAKGNSTGYFKAATWTKDHNSNHRVHEIALNASLLNRADDFIFQTLVRCMMFLWQATHSVLPMQQGYCNDEFTQEMDKIGLPCDKPYGRNLRWSVRAGGRYASVRPASVAAFFPLQSIEMLPPKSKRVKFTCPKCGYAVMGMPGGRLVCHTEECNTAMEKAITE